ncbi:MAG TPA: isochorismate synthase [Anaerolineales bacterium]|nr:isochorismate synthase [Anaerolineales bacterium]
MTALRPGTLLTYALPWPGASLLSFLHLGKGHPRVFWESEKSPLAFAGFGNAAQLTASGPDRFSLVAADAVQLFNHIHRAAGASPTGADPVLAGGFSFRAGGDQKDPYWAAFCEAQFLLPHYQLTRFDGETWLTLNHVLAPGEDSTAITSQLRETAEDLIWQGLSGDYTSPTIDDIPVELRALDITPFTSHDEWVRMITETTQRIHQGELKKAVLARAAHVEFACSLPLADLLARLSARYPDCYRFLIEPQPQRAFFGATPELLGEVSARELRTVALAGSTRRGQTWQEDQMLGQQLLANPKERHEHDLVVRALRENLQSLTVHLEVPDFPELCLLNNIQHLRTPIYGQLVNGNGIIPVVQALHPTPALGGTPREIALQLIGALEPLQRGWYGAPVGWLAPNGSGEFAVAIRSAVANGRRIRLYAGAGIVGDSDPEKEWHETELKFQPILKALGL